MNFGALVHSSTRVLIAASLCLAVLAAFNPASAYDLQEYYYPLEVGNAWLFSSTETRDGKVSRETRFEAVTGTEEVNGKTGYRLESGMEVHFPRWVGGDFMVLNWEPGGLMLYRWFETDGETVESDETFVSPRLFVPARMTLGETRTSDFFSITLMGIDKVTVPAGTFKNCIHFITTEDGGTSEGWLAPGVGIIKQKEIREKDDGRTEKVDELLAARIGNRLYGSPVLDDRFISFVFSTVHVDGCSLLLDGIAVKGFDGFLSAVFEFNWETLAFELAQAALKKLSPAGSQCLGDPLLRFAEENPYVWDHATGYPRIAAFLDGLSYDGEVQLYCEFDFAPGRLEFLLQKVWDKDGKLLISR